MGRRLILLVLMVLLAAAAGGSGRASAQADPTKTPSSVIAPVQTATPRPDGSLVHVVGFGQSLAEIAKAYGVTVADIQRLNGLPPDSNTLYSGQKLLIVPRGGPNPLLAPTATETTAPTLEPTSTSSPEPPAATLVAPAAGSPNNGMVLPLAGGLILLGGFMLLAAALVIQRKK